jgi:FRG domain-containing protein
VRADKNSSSAGGSEEPDAGQRRFREELQQIPMVSHEAYGSCLAPAYPSQLLIALGQLASLPIGAWRGQASADWALDPSQARRYRQHHASRPGSALTEPRMRAMEKALIERARAAGVGKDFGELELLARLQHHGAATRLLDCSRNAFVALWFACRWEPAKDGVLIGFELGDNAVHLDTALLQREIDDLLAMAAGRLLWWQPRGISPRISAQQAAFIFGRVVDEPWGSIRLAQGQVSLGNIGAVPGAAVVFVSARLKAALNGIWGALLGFSEESLFPDFDGFALAHSVDKPFPAEFIIDAQAC